MRKEFLSRPLEIHVLIYNIIYEMNRWSRFDARYRMLGLVHWDDPEGWYWEGGGRGFHEPLCRSLANLYRVAFR